MKPGLGLAELPGNAEPDVLQGKPCISLSVDLVVLGKPVKGRQITNIAPKTASLVLLHLPLQCQGAGTLANGHCPSPSPLWPHTLQSLRHVTA